MGLLGLTSAPGLQWDPTLPDRGRMPADLQDCSADGGSLSSSVTSKFPNGRPGENLGRGFAKESEQRTKSTPSHHPEWVRLQKANMERLVSTLENQD